MNLFALITYTAALIVVGLSETPPPEVEAVLDRVDARLTALQEEGKHTQYQVENLVYFLLTVVAFVMMLSVLAAAVAGAAHLLSSFTAVLP